MATHTKETIAAPELLWSDYDPDWREKEFDWKQDDELWDQASDTLDEY